MKLPMPPSTNHLFVNIPKRGRVLSGQYKAWKNAAGIALNLQRPGNVPGSVEIDIAVPENMRGDIDNRAKPILDLLVSHGVIDDDRNVCRLVVHRFEGIDPGSVFVTVRARKAA